MRKLILVLLLFPLSIFGSSTLNIANIRQDNGITNQWLVLSNGMIVIPPFEFAIERKGANGLAGGIYFGMPGDTDYNPSPAHYLLNLVHRGSYGGQLLISHQSIYLEEQTLGSICLGNDGSAGSVIRIRYEDLMGQNLTTNGHGHSHIMAFESRTKDTNGIIHNGVAGIVAINSGNINDTEAAGGMRGQWGSYGPADLAFFRATPLSEVDSVLRGGKESGRALAAGGWHFNGPIYRDTSIIVDPTTSTNTNMVIDVGTNYFWHRTVFGMVNVIFTNSSPRSSMQQAVIVLNSPAGCNLSLPGWVCMSDNGMLPLPSKMLPGETMMAELLIVPNGITYCKLSTNLK